MISVELPKKKYIKIHKPLVSQHYYSHVVQKNKNTAVQGEFHLLEQKMEIFKIHQKSFIMVLITVFNKLTTT